VDQHYNNLEVALKTIREFTKDHGYALTTLRSKRKGGEVYMVYLQCNRGKFRSDLIVAEQNRRRMKGSRCLDCPFKLILEPRVNRPRGRPMGAINRPALQEQASTQETSIHRDPSEFEVILQERHGCS
jgi:hypothetical protein